MYNYAYSKAHKTHACFVQVVHKERIRYSFSENCLKASTDRDFIFRN